MAVNKDDLQLKLSYKESGLKILLKSFSQLLSGLIAYPFLENVSPSLSKTGKVVSILDLCHFYCLFRSILRSISTPCRKLTQGNLVSERLAGHDFYENYN